MSWQAIRWAMNKSRDYELDPTTRHVALVLGNFEGPKGIFPSLATLEDYTGLSERQIRRCIKKLIAVGLLDYGDQSVVTDNPRYRNDQLPKVYRFVYAPSGTVDTSSVGQMPAKKRRPWSRKPKPAAPATPPPPVDTPPARHRRPDSVSRTPGHTGGQKVHQSFNPLNNPSAHAEPAAEAVDHHAVYRLRTAARERLARQGVQFTDHLFAPMPA
jgi:hypothetical protein